MTSDWAKLLDDALTDGSDTVLPGFLTHQQIAVQWQRSESHTRKLIDKMLETGRLERRYFRVQTLGGIRAVPHYRMTQNAKAA